MESYTNQKSIGGLIRRLADDAQTAIRKELELAKVELSERVAKYGRHTRLVSSRCFGSLWRNYYSIHAPTEKSVRKKSSMVSRDLRDS